MINFEVGFEVIGFKLGEMDIQTNEGWIWFFWFGLDSNMEKKTKPINLIVLSIYWDSLSSY
jgi:hypothetical protein